MPVVSIPIDAEAKERERRVKNVLMHIFLNVTTLCLPIQAVTSLMSELTKGDIALAAQYLGAGASATAAFEFCFNPTMGCYTDANGRKAAVFVGPIVCVIAGPILLLKPNSLPMLQLVHAVSNGANAISGTSVAVPCIADICLGDQDLMAQGMASVAGWAGLGVIAGPLIGSNILSRFGPIAVYQARSVWSLCHVAWLCTRFEETLPEAKRRPFSGLKSPFSFVKLFTATPMLRKLTVFNLLSVFSEGKCLNDLNQLWMKSNLGWTVPQTANWTISYGVAMFFSGYLAKFAIPVCGPRLFTHCAYACGLGAMMINATQQSVTGFWAGLLVNFPAINGIGGSAMKAIATAEAIEGAGMGGGEYAGAYANLRAFIYIIGPLLYSRLYARFSLSGTAGNTWFAVALIGFLLPEMLHLSWKDSELFPKKRTKQAQK